MRKAALTLFFAIISMLSAWADNKSVSVNQVTTAVTLTDDVDYHITSTEPFGESGSINITNTEHAVIIFDKLKPSLAQKQLANVSINGERAYHNQNCQVRIWGSGAMILPYTDTGALTMYTETNLQGESCSDYDLRNSGGYMNTLTTAQLNNKVKSFKLKRGYMVTLSNLPGGYGYSRCFIATYGDLEMNLPNILACKASSYRLFRWNNTNKRGLASNTNAHVNDLLNSTSCYDWATGVDQGLDRECVPNHIYEDWPSSSACGSVTYSPHMKTNNEPGNSADDHPQTVEEVLANWQNLMRTGMRLCSPSSHDGSLSWLAEFIDSIDARGWRCDIMDVHSYWYYKDWSGSMNNFINKYKRPIWVSEYLYGASWSSNWYGNNSSYTQEQKYNTTLDAMKQILPYMNNEKYIERYFYWNGEATGTRLYYDGDESLKDKNYLTPTGEYYAAMELQPSYNPDIQFVPKTPRITAPKNLTLSFSVTSSTATLKWSESNGELLDTMYVERKNGINGTWENIGGVAIQETGGNYTLKDVTNTAGYYIYRVVAVPFNKASAYYSNEVTNILNGASSFGEGALQYGTFSTNTTDLSYMYVDKPYAEEPAVIFGSVSNSNSDMGPIERIFFVKHQYGLFRANLFPWTDATQTDFYKTATDGSITPDFSSYLILPQGHGKVGTIDYEAGKLASTKVGETVEVTFAEPFAEAPVVFATAIQGSTSAAAPVIARAYDVTATGCKIRFMAQKSIMESSSKPSAEAYFIALEKGRTYDGNGLMMTVATVDATFKSATSNTNVLTYDETLEEPTVLVQMQTMNRDMTAILRTRPLYADASRLYLRYQPDPSDTENKSVTSANPVKETAGYVIISKGYDTDKIKDVNTVKGKLAVYPRVVEETFTVTDDKATHLYIYNIGGTKVADSEMTNGQAEVNIAFLPKGVYVVRTNNNRCEKITKK